jgi:hypothetical protein
MVLLHLPSHIEETVGGTYPTLYQFNQREHVHSRISSAENLKKAQVNQFLIGFNGHRWFPEK